LISAVSELLLIVVVVDQEVAGQADRLAPAPQEAGAGRVERTDPHPLRHRATQRHQALAHLARRLVGEGDRQDLPRRDPAVEEPRDPVHQHPGLARAGARQHQQRSVAMFHRRPLLAIERSHHAARLTAPR
jgi:hypothetical protein